MELTGLGCLPKNKGIIDLEEPLLSYLTKILKTNIEKKFVSVILQDSNNNKMLAFIYGEFSDLLISLSDSYDDIIPMPVTILKSEVKELDEHKYYMEIYHIIFENNIFINYSSLGPHEFCSMQSYLNTYLNVESAPNSALLWGNIFHDYLSLLYSNPIIYSNSNKSLLYNK